MWFWTDYLLAFVVVYATFLITTCLFRNTKFGKALYKFASQPKPTTAAGWLELEFGGADDPPAALGAAAAGRGAGARPSAPVDARRRSRKRRGRKQVVHA
jgi:hypothetical protein